jgi:hypothetical protein
VVIKGKFAVVGGGLLLLAVVGRIFLLLLLLAWPGAPELNEEE